MLTCRRDFAGPPAEVIGIFRTGSKAIENSAELLTQT